MFSHILSLDGLSNTYSLILETATSVRMVESTYLPRTGGGVRSL